MTLRPIRLVVTDVDGTLVRPDRTLAPATLAAVARLRAAGVKLALVSSRPPRGLDMLSGPLGLDTPRAGFNGAVIEDAAGNVVEQHTIATDATGAAVALLEAAGVDVWLFAGNAWLLTNPDGACVAEEHAAVGMKWRRVATFSPHLAGVHKVMASSADHDRIGALETVLHQRIGAEATVHRSQPWYLDITHRDANKGAAALALARLLGVDAAAMACLGDMANDVPMFAVAGLAIAMGNAPASVQARAHAVTAGNDADGWAAAIDRFVLPRP